MNELALFAGAGGGILGGSLVGFQTVCAVEIEPYAASILVTRQNDGILPPFPIWDDILTFDGRPWHGIVDVVSGGFPCQDISAAGKGAGIDGERSGLWFEMFRVVCEVRPRFVFVENSPMLTLRGLNRVLKNLASMGYDAEWGVLGADDAGAPHIRKRIWILAYAKQARLEGLWTDARQSEKPKSRNYGTQIFNSNSSRFSEHSQCNSKPEEHSTDRHSCWRDIDRPDCSTWWAVEPDVGRVAHGVAARVDRLKAIGNGQVPAVAAKAWRVLRQKSRAAAEHYGNRPEHRPTGQGQNLEY